MPKLDFSKKPTNVGVKVEKKLSIKDTNIDSSKVVKIPVSLLEIGENIRNQKDDSELEELAESIKEYGQLEPVIVYKDGDKYVVKVGSRRARACIVHNIPTVDCIVSDNPWKDEKERIILQAIENEHRINMSTKERETYIKKLQDIGLSNNEIAAALHKPKSMISEALKALDARNENADIFENLDGETSTRSTYDFSTLSKEQKENVKEKVLENGNTADAFTQAVKEEKERIKKEKQAKESEKNNSENITNDEVNSMFDIDESDDFDIIEFDDSEESEETKETTIGINLKYSINETDKVFKWTCDRKTLTSKVEKFILKQIENFYIEEGYSIV